MLVTEGWNTTVPTLLEYLQYSTRGTRYAFMQVGPWRALSGHVTDTCDATLAAGLPPCILAGT